MKEKEQKNKSLLKKVLKGTAVGAGVGAGSSEASKKLSKAFRESARKSTEQGRKKDIKKILNKAKEKGINVSEGDSTAYNAVKNSIRYNKKNGPAGIAHEIGHADIYNNIPVSNKKAVKFSNKLEEMSDKISPVAAGAGVGTHMAIKDKNPELAKKVRNATLLSTGLSSLPSIAEEATASYKGLKHLKSLNSLKKNDINNLGKQLGGYASSLAPLIASGAYFAYDKHKGGDDD